jgi:tetratricopeptide (TPR) repeat protein/peroxiredoxin
MPQLGPAIAFRLTGTKSNRDAIGAAVTVETPSLRQTLFLQAGSGFLAQHSKELFFGLRETQGPVAASIRWPSGLVQNLRDLPINHRIWVEEGSPSLRQEPFKTPASLAAGTSPAPIAEASSLPVSAETWLLVPVSAPDFSSADLGGRTQSLSALRGKRVLLYFWSSALPNHQRELAEFDQSHAGWAKDGLQFLSVNADDLSAAGDITALEFYRHFSFPILVSSPDVIAVYSILFRYLFDRHRDMPLPTAFLIDESGAIVKIYQGPVQREHIDQDFRQIPRTAGERLAEALPFPGVSETSDFGRNYLSFGSIFFDRGYFDQAEVWFKLALQDSPSSADALYGLGSVYLQQKKSAQARESFERALQLPAGYPGTLPNAWNNLGILAAREGHIDEAIQNFQRSLKIDPDHLIALDNLANAYRQLKRWDDAKTVLQRALRVNPDDPEANYSLGMVFAQLNDTQQAYDYLRKALAARPVYPEALNNLGILYVRTQRREEAEKSFQESIRVAPEFDPSYLNLARLYVLEGDAPKARAVLLDLLKQHPGHAQAEKELQELPQ